MSANIIWELDLRAVNDEASHSFIAEITSCDPLEYWRYAVVKFDGCIHLYQAFNVPFCHKYGFHGDIKRDSCDDYTHICSIKREIESLMSLHLCIFKKYDNFGK